MLKMDMPANIMQLINRVPSQAGAIILLNVDRKWWKLNLINIYFSTIDILGHEKVISPISFLFFTAISNFERERVTLTVFFCFKVSFIVIN